VLDLQDDYFLDISDVIGAGMPPQINNLDEFAIIPGATLNSIKIAGSPVTFVGVVRGTSPANLNANKQTLIDALSPGAFPTDDNGVPQPVLIRYTSAAVQKEISLHYESGLEGNLSAREPCAWERAAVRFIAPDPFWYEIGDSAQLLDADDTLGARTFWGRMRDPPGASPGQWDEIAAAQAAGEPMAIIIGADRNIYLGGSFTDWNANVNLDYITSYDRQANTWGNVGAPGDIGNTVRALLFGPDDTLYAGGDFLNAGADPLADYIAQFSAGVWSNVGGGGTGNVYALAFDIAGSVIYIGGNFVNWNALPAGDYIVQWESGVGYTVLSTGADNIVRALVVAEDDTLYVAGDFLNIGGVAANRIASWDGTNFSALGTGLNNIVRDIVIDDDGNIIVCGDFTTAGGNTAYGVAMWDGNTWSAFDRGLSAAGGGQADVYQLSIAPDGTLYAVGNFDWAGTDIYLIGSAARWNGYNWTQLDIFTGANGRVVLTGYPSPITTESFEINLGFISGAVAPPAAGATIVTNDGTASAFPRFHATYTGTGDARLLSLINETDAKEIYFRSPVPALNIAGYLMREGETVTLDLRPTIKEFISSFLGETQGALRSGYDVGSFLLRPGANDINTFLYPIPSPYVAWLQWRDKYLSYD